jgi:hypothetical protein
MAELSQLGVNPARMTLTNLANGVRKEAQFNPSELAEKIAVVWTKMTVPGHSHQPKHFTNTGNQGWDLDLFFDAHDIVGAGNDHVITKRFLYSLCYPRREGGGPPRVLLVWPNVVSQVVTLESMTIRNSLFFQNGSVAQFVATCSFEEIRDTKLFSDDVLRLGNRRAGGLAVRGGGGR